MPRSTTGHWGRKEEPHAPHETLEERDMRKTLEKVELMKGPKHPRLTKAERKAARRKLDEERRQAMSISLREIQEAAREERRGLRDWD